MGKSNRKKFRVIDKKEISSKKEYVFESKESQDGEVTKIINNQIDETLTLVIMDYITNEPKYVFDNGYIEDYQFERSQDGFDEDELLYECGNHNPLDYDTISDFMTTSSSDYDVECDWGKYYYREIPIENEILDKVKETLKDNVSDLKNKIKRLDKEVIFEEINLLEKVTTLIEETIEYKATGEIDERETAQTKEYIIEDEEKEDILNKLLVDDIMDDVIEALLEPLELNENFFSDYIQEYYDSICFNSFKELYLKGCKLLGISNDYYKEIKYSGNEIESFILDILIDSVKRDSLIDSNGNIAKSYPIHNGYKPNVFKNTGFSKGYHICNTATEIEDAIDYIRNRVIAKSIKEDKVIEYLKLLSSIYAYQISCSYDYEIKNITVEGLKAIFKHEYLRNALLATNIELIIKVLYPRCEAYESVKKVLPQDPKDYYPKARSIKRHFVLHVGPTNSGKTYESLEKFKSKDSGVYLAPLRLLALEVQEKMLSDNLKCNLITGEEEDIIEDANHLCCTIEKLNFNKYYDIAVIDEGQMLEDPQRGSAWTSAILGVYSEEVHVCLANHSQEIIIELIKYCEDTYEIVNHDRDTELIVSDENFDFLKDLQKGDAIVAFSKRKVLNLSATINTKTNLSCSVLFGSLPYRSRKRQFENFANGKSDILVTTDAVGMGVNLAIKRIIFMEDSKYDGKQTRKLRPSEILQIAGRAGRKNIYDQGYVIVTDKSMKSRYNTPIPQIKSAYIGITHHLSEIEGKLEDIIFAWQQLELKSPFVKADISNQINILNRISEIPLSKEDRFKAMFLPVNTSSIYETLLLEEYLEEVSRGCVKVKFPHKPALEYDNELKQLEDYSKAIDLYYSVCKTYGLEMDLGFVDKQRELTCNKINTLLLSDNLEIPRCNCCGEELEWDYDRYRCRECYSSRRNYNYWDDEDEDDDDYDFDEDLFY